MKIIHVLPYQSPLPTQFAHITCRNLSWSLDSGSHGSSTWMSPRDISATGATTSGNSSICWSTSSAYKSPLLLRYVDAAYGYAPVLSLPVTKTSSRFTSRSDFSCNPPSMIAISSVWKLNFSYSKSLTPRSMSLPSTIFTLELISACRSRLWSIFLHPWIIEIDEETFAGWRTFFSCCTQRYSS